MLLNLVSIGIVCHYQNNKVAFIVGVVECSASQLAINEGDREIFEQACLLVAVEVFVQRIVYSHRYTVHIQQYLLRLWQ